MYSPGLVPGFFSSANSCQPRRSGRGPANTGTLRSLRCTLTRPTTLLYAFCAWHRRTLRAWRSGKRPIPWWVPELLAEGSNFAHFREVALFIRRPNPMLGEQVSSDAEHWLKIEECFELVRMAVLLLFPGYQLCAAKIARKSAVPRVLSRATVDAR